MIQHGSYFWANNIALSPWAGNGILLYEENGIEKAQQQAGMKQILRKAGGKLETSIAMLQSNAHKSSFTPLKLITHAFHVTLGAWLWNYI